MLPRMAIAPLWFFVFLSALLLLSAGGYAQAPSWTWQAETVDSGGAFPSLAVDKQLNLHLSYVRTGGSIMYAFRPAATSQWFKLSVDPGGGSANMTTGIALDSQGNPHICLTPGPLKYSHFDGHQWKTDFIGANTSLLEYTCSIKISDQGVPQIIWYQTHNEDGTPFLHIRYAAKRDGIWTTQTIDFDFETGKWNSIALDASGTPHISYSALSGGELRYASLDGDKWSVNIIDSRNFKDNGSFNRGFGNSITLDQDESPHISYYHDTLLKYARKVNGVWKTEVVDTVSGSRGWSGYKSVILLDSHGLPHICYEDSGAVKHAYWDGAKWRIQLITAGGLQARWPSAAIDANDTIYIAYRDSFDSSLKVSIGKLSNQTVKSVGTTSGDH